MILQNTGWKKGDVEQKLSYFENDKHVKLNSLAIPSSLDALVYCDCN